MLVSVNAAELKAAFRDIKPLCKNTDSTAILGFTLKDHILYITCSGNAVYERRIVVSESGPYALTVLYRDLAELLPTRDVVELRLEPLYVEVCTEYMSVTLPQANGLVSLYKERATARRPIQAKTLRKLADTFSEAAPVAKALKREAPVVFEPEFSIMKFPTFWLQTVSSGLTGSVSLDDLKAVAQYEPEEVGITDDVLEFHRPSSIMVISRNQVGDCKSADCTLSRHAVSGEVVGGAYLPKVQQLLRSVGAGPCRCSLCNGGIEIQVNRPKVQSCLRVGPRSAPIVAFDSFLEYMQMCFKLLGTSPIFVSKGEGSVCLQTDQIKLLFSIV